MCDSTKLAFGFARRRRLLGAAIVLAIIAWSAGWTYAADADAPDAALIQLQASLDAAQPGKLVVIGAHRYKGDIHITQPKSRIWAVEGVEIHGTVHVEAPDVSLIALTVITDDRCIVVGPQAKGLRAYFNRLVISSPTGVALEVAGTETAGMELFENQIYNVGGVNPDLDHRGFRHKWKPFTRAGKGIVVRGVYAGKGTPLRIHHNRISGYEVGLELVAGETPLNARVWLNRITANTTGMVIAAGGCEVEQNRVLRSTGVGIVTTGKGNLISGNRIFDSAGYGMEATDAKVHNNVLVRNHGGIVAVGESEVAHNTFHGNEGEVLHVADDASVLFVNNLVDHSGTLFNESGTLTRHNNVYANGTSPTQEEGSRSGEVAYPQLPAENFRPRPDSIAVDAATSLAGITRDAANSGRRIGDAPDAGAYEVGPADAPGRQWWVATTGDDDAGDGSSAKPFGSVAHAALQAGAGDRILLQAGRYEGDQTITCAGAEGHPVRIMPAPGVAHARGLVTRMEALKPLEMTEPKGGKVVIAGGSWKLVNSPFLTIEGLEFRDSPHSVINLGARSSNVTIRNCVFINCPTSDPNGRDWHAGITGSGPEANDVLIENNIFDRRPNGDWVYLECDSINPFEGAWCKRWVIRNNKFAGYDKLQLGHGGKPDLSTLGSPPSFHLIEDNEFFECNRAIHIKSSDNIFRRNYIHDMVPGYTRKWVGMMDRSGERNVYDGNIVVGAPYAGILLLGRDNTVMNNVFVRCKVGVLVGMRTFGGGVGQGRWSGRTHVYHNTFVDSVRAVQIDAKRDALVFNNLIYNSPGSNSPPTAPAVTRDGTGVFPIEELDWSMGERFLLDDPGLIRAGHNLYWNAEPPYLRNYEGGDHYDIYADPLFVDPAAGDYRLRPDSPARRRGRSLNVGHDQDDQSRPTDAPDIGAYQSTRP